MKITPFAVEQWMNAYETRCAYNLAETCIESLTVAELLDMAGQRSSFFDELLRLKLTYGEILGSERLLAAIAALYASRSASDVLVAHGAAGANALVYQALIEPADRVVTIVPTYQQHVSIPESLGAEVVPFRLRAEDRYAPDLESLRHVVTPKTKLIAFSNPNNPTGSVMDEHQLKTIVQIADAVGAYVLSDEVYRGIHQEDCPAAPSIVDLYAKGISTGSMSKAYSLAGLRLGWICGPAEVLRLVELHRDYNTISVSRVDDLLAAIALENREAILTRGRGIVRTNLAALDAWMASQPSLKYVKPAAGTTALLHYAFDLPSTDFCLKLLDQTGVLFTPGSALGIEHTVRIGYANNPAILAEGLHRTAEFLNTL